MSDMSDVDWAYLAGFIDADGCISLTQTPITGTVRFQITVSQANKSILDYWQVKTQYGRVTPMSSPPGMWQWQIGKPECDGFLKGIYPYLLLKKEEAAIAIRYRATFDKNSRYSRVTTATMWERVACVQAMKEKKDGRSVPLPVNHSKLNDLECRKSIKNDIGDVSKPTAIQMSFSRILT